MPSTPINALRYPDNTNQPAGPQQIANLAADADTKMMPRFANTAARNSAIPSPVVGMFCTVAGILQEYSSSGWGPPPIQSYASNAARDSALPSPQTGMKVIVGGIEMTWLNGAWRFANSGTIILQTSSDGAIQFPHGLPGTPSVVLLTQGGAETDAINAIAHPVVTGKDTVNIYVTVYRIDNQQKFTGNIVPLFWRAEV